MLHRRLRRPSPRSGDGGKRSLRSGSEDVDVADGGGVVRSHSTKDRVRQCGLQLLLLLLLLLSQCASAVLRIGSGMSKNDKGIIVLLVALLLLQA